MLEKNVTKLIDELNKNISFLSLEQDNIFKLCEESTRICNRALEQCKELVLKKGFKNTQEEIKFFKEFKPAIASKLKYYHMVFKLENAKPLSENAKKIFYEKELAQIDNYFKSNIEFMTYYKTGSEYLDSTYFLRNNSEHNMLADESYFFSDKKFTTTHDDRISQILACELLAIHIRKEINNLEKREGMEPIKQYHKTLVWTDSKVFLVELIYALHTAGSFNRGTLELKELAQTLSESCNIDLGDIYRTWAEIKLRKEPTKYLDILKALLENRINNDLK